MKKYGVRTAEYATFTDVNEALKWAGSAGLTTVTTLEDISKEDIIKNLEIMNIINYR